MRDERWHRRDDLNWRGGRISGGREIIGRVIAIKHFVLYWPRKLAENLFYF